MTSTPGRRSRRGTPASTCLEGSARRGLELLPVEGRAGGATPVISAPRPASPTAWERQMDEMIRAACHELRGHLSCALLSGQLLQDEARYRGLDEATRRAGCVVMSALRMDAVLTALSESAHVASRPLEVHPQRLRLDQLLDLALRGLTDPHDPDHLEPSRVQLRVPPDLPPVSGDPGLLQRAFTCLLTHSLRTAPATPVEVDLAAAGGEVRVAVADHGPGIPHDDLPLVFGRYYRPPGRDAGVAAGVGLFVVRQIVEAHAGRVWVESEPGQGATLGLALPAATPPRRSRPRRPTTV